MKAHNRGTAHPPMSTRSGPRSRRDKGRAGEARDWRWFNVHRRDVRPLMRRIDCVSRLTGARDRLRTGGRAGRHAAIPAQPSARIRRP